jgi:hypothetical protein
MPAPRRGKGRDAGQAGKKGGGNRGRKRREMPSPFVRAGGLAARDRAAISRNFLSRRL